MIRGFRRLLHPIQYLVIPGAVGTRSQLRQPHRRHGRRGHDATGDPHGAGGKLGIHRRRQEVKVDCRGPARIGGGDVDMPLAFRPHRVGVAGHAGLAGQFGALWAGLDEHRHPAEQQVGCVQPFAGADEGADRGSHHAEHAAVEQSEIQRLPNQAEAPAPVVEGDTFRADRPPGPRRVVVTQVLADARQGMSQFDAEVAQPFRLANARQFQQLRGVDRPGAYHDLAGGTRFAPVVAHRIPDTDATFTV